MSDRDHDELGQHAVEGQPSAWSEYDQHTVFPGGAGKRSGVLKDASNDIEEPYVYDDDDSAVNLHPPSYKRSIWSASRAPTTVLRRGTPKEDSFPRRVPRRLGEASVPPNLRRVLFEAFSKALSDVSGFGTLDLEERLSWYRSVRLAAVVKVWESFLQKVTVRASGPFNDDLDLLLDGVVVLLIQTCQDILLSAINDYIAGHASLASAWTGDPGEHLVVDKRKLDKLETMLPRQDLFAGPILSGSTPRKMAREIINQIRSSQYDDDRPFRLMGAPNETPDELRRLLSGWDRIRDVAQELSFLAYEAHYLGNLQELTTALFLTPETPTWSGSPDTSARRVELDFDPLARVSQRVEEGRFDAPAKGIPPLRHMLAVTGCESAAHAGSLATYADFFWPEVAEDTLDALEATVAALWQSASVGDATVVRTQKTIRLRGSMNPVDLGAPQGEPQARSCLEVLFSRRKASMIFHGFNSDLDSVLKLLTWISAAFPIGSIQNTTSPTFCIPEPPDPVATGDTTSQPLSLTFRHRPAQSILMGQCWYGLMPSTPIAQGFPIPSRTIETGLEIALAVACVMIGASHAAEYDGGVVIKGFSAMLLPLKMIGDSIQWHVVYGKDGAALSYEEGIGQCPKRALVDTISMKQVRHSKCFIGWHADTISMLGSSPDRVDYSKIRRSTAKDPGSSLRMDKVSVGFQQIVTVQADISLSSHTYFSFLPHQRRFASVIEQADSTRILLYDTRENRGWLVPASEVIVHIAQYRKSQRLPVQSRTKVPIDIQESAAQTMRHNAELLMDEDGYTFSAMATHIWEALEFLQAELAVRQKRVGRLRLKTTTSLLGYEFRDCAADKSNFSLRQFDISHGNKGWASLIRDTDTLVLFSSGLGDLIMPREEGGSKQLCSRWKRMPVGLCFMATTVRTLKQLYSEAPADTTGHLLTSTKLQCFSENEVRLFEPCEVPRESCCCKRQQTIARGSQQPALCPDDLEPNGAIIFGAAHKGRPLGSRHNKGPERLSSASSDVDKVPQTEGFMNYIDSIPGDNSSSKAPSAVGQPWLTTSSAVTAQGSSSAAQGVAR